MSNEIQRIMDRDCDVRNTLTTTLIINGVFSDISKTNYNHKIIEHIQDRKNYTLTIHTYRLNNEVDLKLFRILLGFNRVSLEVTLNDLIKLYTGKTKAVKSYGKTILDSLKRLSSCNIVIQSKLNKNNESFNMIDSRYEDYSKSVSNPTIYLQMSKVATHYRNSSYLSYLKQEYLDMFNSVEKVIYCFTGLLTKKQKQTNIKYSDIVNQVSLFANNDSKYNSVRHRNIIKAFDRMIKEKILYDYKIDKEKDTVFLSANPDIKVIQAAIENKEANIKAEIEFHLNEIAKLQSLNTDSRMTDILTKSHYNEKIQEQNTELENDYHNRNIAIQNKGD